MNEIKFVIYVIKEKMEQDHLESPRIDFNKNPLLWIQPKVKDDFSVPSDFQTQ